MTTITLSADALLSKSGFDDGNILDDILCDNGFTDWDLPYDEHLFFNHEVLAIAVERHLLPLCPSVQTYRVGTIHNPIRIAPSYTGEVPDVTVTLDAGEILRIAKEVKSARDQRAKNRA